MAIGQPFEISHLDRAGYLEHTIRKRRLSVVNVCDYGKVAYMFLLSTHDAYCYSPNIAEIPPLRNYIHIINVQYYDDRYRSLNSYAKK